jgi:hypothetical protein
MQEAINVKLSYDISGSHGSEYGDGSLLGYNAV